MSEIAMQDQPLEIRVMYYDADEFPHISGQEALSQLHNLYVAERKAELELLVRDMDNIGRLTNYAKIKSHVIDRIATLEAQLTLNGGKA